jgi:hypothetical protein
MSRNVPNWVVIRLGCPSYTEFSAPDAGDEIIPCRTAQRDGVLVFSDAHALVVNLDRGAVLRSLRRTLRDLLSDRATAVSDKLCPLISSATNRAITLAPGQ